MTTAQVKEFPGTTTHLGNVTMWIPEAQSRCVAIRCDEPKRLLKLIREFTGQTISLTASHERDLHVVTNQRMARQSIDLPTRENTNLIIRHRGRRLYYFIDSRDRTVRRRPIRKAPPELRRVTL